MRRTISELLLSACAVAVVLAVLVAFDSRVREQATLLVGGAHASTELVAAQSSARHLAAVVAAVAKDQSEQHAPLMIFICAATALTLFMVRT